MTGSLFIHRSKVSPPFGRWSRQAVVLSFRILRLLGLLVFLSLLRELASGNLQAQPVVRWTTNYYTVTGASFREVRRSLNERRPWKGKEEADAMTTWSVTWNYTAFSGPSGCRPDKVTTEVTIVTRLPRYVPSTNAPVELRERWARYFAALARHEAQHAAVGRAAALDVQGALMAAGERSDCDILRHALTTQADALLQQRRREDQEIDRRTQHGATEGARFP